MYFNIYIYVVHFIAARNLHGIDFLFNLHSKFTWFYSNSKYFLALKYIFACMRTFCLFVIDNNSMPRSYCINFHMTATTAT